MQTFELAFNNTTIPDQCHFGYSWNLSTIGLMYHSIYLISVSANKFQIIVDKENLKYKTKVIGISKTKSLDLYWAEVDVADIQKAILDKDLWKHYNRATQIIPTYSKLIGVRPDLLEGKMLLTKLYQPDAQTDLKLDLEKFDKQVLLSSKMSRDKRLARLAGAAKKPSYKEVTVKVFIRNPDVVAEVLFNANEKCGHCKRPAPFKKDSNGLGYLEVHHVQPLSEGGDDTVENSIALCANCHRHAHYGKKSFGI